MDNLDSNGQFVEVQHVNEHVSLEQRAAHSANPAANPLPADEFIVKPGEPSRLPAGSTLEMAPGLHVPHPHAEVNLPGKPDPRVGASEAVTERLNHAQGAIDVRPLPDDVKPKTLSVDGDAVEVQLEHPAEAAAAVAASTPAVKVVLAQ